MASNSTQPVYTANLGVTSINTANSRLDGGGTLSTLLVGAANGTYVKSLIIKAQTNTSQGMVRFFVQNSGGNNLVQEINVPPVIRSGRDLSFGIIINLNYTLKAGETLKVSTEKNDTFNVFAEAFDLSYLVTPEYLGTSTEYTIAAGSNLVNTANTRLDGGGDIVQIITAGTAGSSLGCAITSITIKALSSCSPGMIRLFIHNPSTGDYTLFWEVMVPSVTQSATIQSFGVQVLGGSFCIPSDFSIGASTELEESFSLAADGFDWKNV